jgi:UDP-glucose 4-epimerase
MMESLRVLITGGAGFIGSHCMRALAIAGHSVKVLDNLSTGSLDKIWDFLDVVEFIRGDVRDKNAVEDALKGIDVVVHLAALVDVTESVEKPVDYFDVNVHGTLNVVLSSKNISVLVFASSCAVYGEPAYLPINEEHPLNPKSSYAASKASGEAYVVAYASLYGFRPIILRLFNVYGPGQSKPYADVITKFIKRVTEGKPPVIYGNGQQTRDFIYVDDAVQAIISALTSDKAYGAYNIGSGNAVSINELAKMVLKAVGREDLKLLYASPRLGDIKHSVADISKAVKELSFNPRMTVEDGIKMLINGISGYDERT